MTTQPKFYIEWWTVGDNSKNVEANTFHIPKRSVGPFIKSFMKTGKYVVHLEMIEPMRKVLFSRKRPQHAV